jgi:actin-like ATPase involved in cell morphogenesis
MAYSLGLDIGTTYSAAAIARDGRVEVVTLGHEAASVPSVLYLRDDGTFLVGDPARRRGLTDPSRVAREFKRRFGDTTPILLGGTPWSADALTARLLRHLHDAVVEQAGEAPAGVAVTHPANWGPYKIDLLRQATHLADLGDAVLATEPEAAAVYYASTERLQPGDVVAVYDLGGGTFDAAVLRATAGGFELLGEPEGIERFGGIDFDEAVIAYVSGFVGPALGELDAGDPDALSAMARLRAECVEAKETLSADTEASIPVLLPSVQTHIRITRGEFEAMIRPGLGETVDALSRALRSARVEPAEVRAVLLVGGSSRIPLVGQLVGAELGRPVAVDTHPKYAVALGAALVAAGQGAPAATTTSGREPAPALVQASPAVAPGAAAVADPQKPPVSPSAPTPPSAPSAPDRASSAPDPASSVSAAPPAPPPAAPSTPNARPSRPSGPAWKSPRVLIPAAAAVVVLGVVVGVLLTRGEGGSTALPPVKAEVPSFDVGLSAVSIAATPDVVWLGDSDGANVVRFDVTAQRVTSAIKLADNGGPTFVAVTPDAVWAVDQSSGVMSKIDPKTNSVVATYAVGQHPNDVLFAAGSLWVPATNDGVVSRIDPVTGETTAIHVRGQPTHVAFGANTLWVTDPSSNKLARIDTSTNTVVGDADTGGCPDYVAADDTAVWVQDECKTDQVFKVDPQSGKVVGSATVGHDAKALALQGQSLWVTNVSDGTISEVDTASASTRRTLRVGRDDYGLSVRGGTVWVASSNNSSLAKIGA